MNSKGSKSKGESSASSEIKTCNKRNCETCESLTAGDDFVDIDSPNIIVETKEGDDFMHVSLQEEQGPSEVGDDYVNIESPNVISETNELDDFMHISLQEGKKQTSRVEQRKDKKASGVVGLMKGAGKTIRSAGNLLMGTSSSSKKDGLQFVDDHFKLTDESGGSESDYEFIDKPKEGKSSKQKR